MAERASPPLRTALQLNLLTSLASVLARRLSGFIRAADVTLLSCTKIPFNQSAEVVVMDF